MYIEDGEGIHNTNRHFFDGLKEAAQEFPEITGELNKYYLSNLTEENKRAFVLSNLGLCVEMATRVAVDYGGEVNLIDLIQEGFLVLEHCARNYKPDKRTEVSTYVVKSLKRRLTRKAFKECGEPMYTLNEPLGDDSDTERIEIMPDNHKPVEYIAMHNTLMEQIRALIDEPRLLTDNESQALRLRYLVLEDSPSLAREVGEQMGYSRSSVDNFCESGIDKIRRRLGLNDRP